MQEDLTKIKRIRNGDIDVFGELVDKYRNRLFGFLVKMTGSRHDSEEILQEVFIRAYSNIDRYDDRWMFSTWIYRIAINVYKNYRRKTGRYKTVSMDDAVLVDSSAGEGNPEHVYEKSERQRELISLINSLKDKQRIPLILKYVRNCSYAEIGDILGISEEAAKMRVMRARKIICKKYMERHRGDF